MQPFDCPPNEVSDQPDDGRGSRLKHAAMCAAAFAKNQIGGRFCGTVAMAMMAYLRNLNDTSWSATEIDVMLSTAIDVYMAADG